MRQFIYWRVIFTTKEELDGRIIGFKCYKEIQVSRPRTGLVTSYSTREAHFTVKFDRVPRNFRM